MSDQEKFEAFKENVVKENEEKYGAEVREKYGDGEADAFNRKILNMTEAEWKAFQDLETKIRDSLKNAVLTGIRPESGEAKKIVGLHKEWLCKTWKQYTAEAHRGVAMLYVTDERFKGYYDKEVEGCAAFLEQAVRCWAGKD